MKIEKIKHENENKVLSVKTYRWRKYYQRKLNMKAEEMTR
jgi:hypothetical protein